MRLTHARNYEAVYATRMRAAVGPLLVHGRPNDLDHCRLGLAVSRRAGSAVARSRMKRLIREAFRLAQNDLPCGYDLVVSARGAASMKLADYQQSLKEAARVLHDKWSKKLHAARDE
ncbi:MAG: ribonuclease P protein component [Planctomycetota bacterium]|jgi:ribonuclease P protein component